MTNEFIHDDLIRIAFNKTDGQTFERFANAFYSGIIGATFVPVGGMHDGGADAREGAIYEDAKRPETYYQMSIEAKYQPKIRKTIKRLREFGRDPKSLTYLTPIQIKNSDRVERDIAEDLDVTINIKDGNYIALHINNDQRSRFAFSQYLGHYTAFLKKVGATNLISTSKYVKSAGVYVFLANEIQRREGDESLADSITDALILWALEGTDPELNIFRTDGEVLERIMTELPGVGDLVSPRLTRRLEAMSKQSKTLYTGSRPVQWHAAKRSYCLPFPTREGIELENAADEALRLRVIAGFEQRLIETTTDSVNDEYREISVGVALRTLQLTFEREGTEFSSFLRKNNSNDYPTIVDILREALIEMSISGQRALKIGDNAFLILRGVLYDSTEDERQYLHRLSRTYTLLFTLNTDPKLIEYIQEMTSEFQLYVGADQIIRALSEYYLEEPDQLTANNLLMTKRLGADLILTETVLKEVIFHLRSCDWEFTKRIQKVEQHVSYDFIRNVPQIMLRAYLYTKINPKLAATKPPSWEAFVNRFVDYKTLRNEDAFTDLRLYLQSRFSFSYESITDLKALVDEDQVGSLANELIPSKKDPELAYNDALLALAVYGRRQKSGEYSKVSEFGWSTWWLTEETAILRFTGEIVKRNTAGYMMRPAFLLNFLTLVPSASEVRRDFARIFPSMVGVRLAHQMSDQAFNDIMDKIVDGEAMDEPRRLVAMNKMVNKLKSNFSRQFMTDKTGKRLATIDVAAARFLED